MYKEAQANHNLVLPLPPNQINESAVSSVLNQDYWTEAETYLPLLKYLRKHLQKGRTKSTVGAKVWETDGTGLQSLEGRRPNCSITTVGLKMFDPLSIITIWEAEAYKNDLNKDGIGQLYSYLKLSSVTQPDRLKFVGVLSNLRQNQVVTLTKISAKTKYTAPEFICKSYRPIELGAVITYLRDSILPDPECHSHVTPFSYDLGDITRRVDNPTFHLVAAFKVPKRFTRASGKDRWINPPELRLRDHGGQAIAACDQQPGRAACRVRDRPTALHSRSGWTPESPGDHIPQYLEPQRVWHAPVRRAHQTRHQHNALGHNHHGRTQRAGVATRPSDHQPRRPLGYSHLGHQPRGPH